MKRKALIVIAASLIGGFISRWHGGGFLGGAKVWKNIAWALPFAIVTGIAYYPRFLLWITIAAAIVCFAACLAGKATGHGGFMDLASWIGKRTQEALEWIIAPLKKHIPEYWYDALGLVVVGFAAVSGAVVTIAFISPLAAAIIALGGIMKAPSYIIGKKFFKQFTVFGELFTGVFAYGCLACALLVLIYYNNLLN